jgi:AraC-like DNA-binding protein
MTETVAETALGVPAPRLRGAIAHYAGYRLLGFAPGLHRGLPSRHLTFIVSIGDPIDVVVQPDPLQAPDSYRFVTGGFQTTNAVIAHCGNQEGVAIELTPIGCRALLGRPARDLWNVSIEAGDLIGGAGTELWERLQGSVGWRERFAICDEVLGRLVDAPPVRRDRPEVWRAWDLLDATDGTVTVNELAAEVGWSRRHLAKTFDAEFGFTPKVAARVMRFERANQLLRSATRPSIADVAAVCGYYDQSHLTRDFVDLAGTSPGDWLATEHGSVEPDAEIIRLDGTDRGDGSPLDLVLAE